eukprot:2052164-Heterocapsa_arctica.AAC.1
MALAVCPRCAGRTANGQAGLMARAKEPAWHRRGRRLRSAARTLLAVARAGALLAAHHSWPAQPQA